MPEALEDVRRRRRRRRATDHDEDAARRLDSEDQTEAERVADHLASAGRSLAEVRQMLDALSEAQRTAVVARLGQRHGNAFVVHLLQRPNVEGWLALHIVLQANPPTPELQMVVTQLRGKGVRFTAEASRVLLTNPEKAVADLEGALRQTLPDSQHPWAGDAAEWLVQYLKTNTNEARLLPAAPEREGVQVADSPPPPPDQGLLLTGALPDLAQQAPQGCQLVVHF